MRIANAIGSCALILLSVSPEARRATASIPTGRDVSGAWVLNRAASEEPQPDVMAADIAELVKPYDRLVIRLVDGRVTFYDEDGARRTHGTQGGKDRCEFRGLTVETRVRWDGAALRIERTLERGGRTVVEIYSVDSQSHRLVVAVTPIERGVTAAVRIRHVYDPLVPRW